MIRAVCFVAVASLADFGCAPSQPDLTFDQIRAAQAGLLEDGYSASEPSGRWRYSDADAIRDYQRDWALPEIAELTAELQARLAREHPETIAQWTSASNNGCQVWNAYPMAREQVTWSGACKNGKAEGKGRMEWSYLFYGERRGEWYQGVMVGGLPHGEGVYAWDFGDRYEGGFRDGLFDGQGFFYGAEGDNYLGEFRNDLPNGKGTYKAIDGSLYSGNWTDGCYSEGDAALAVLTTFAACGF